MNWTVVPFCEYGLRNALCRTTPGKCSPQTSRQKLEAEMETRRLGNSDLSITPIGIGAWAMGGSGWTWSWGPQNDNDSIAAIHDALDRGINWIDTAAVYGLGHSEEVVREALRGRSQRPYVF